MKNVKIQKQVVITDLKTQGNSFGDRAFQVTVELRVNGQVEMTKLFEDTAQEGEHAAIKRLLTMKIKEWALAHGTKFTGWV